MTPLSRCHDCGWARGHAPSCKVLPPEAEAFIDAVTEALTSDPTDAGGTHQQVIVTQLADRHRAIDRDFATSYEVIADASPLPDVLRHVAEHLDLPTGRYTITIGDPYS